MKKLLIIALVASLQSCISSLQPLVTLETITTDQRITGVWGNNESIYTIVPLPESDYAKGTEQDNKDAKPLNAEEKRDSMLLRKMYVVSIKENGVAYNFGAKLIKLNGQLFADLYPLSMNDGKAKEDPFVASNDYLPGFSIAKIELNGGNMTIKFIDGEFVSTQVREGRMKLKHESNELFGTFMVTASTEELKQFISKYGNDERIFSKNTTITLTRSIKL